MRKILFFISPFILALIIFAVFLFFINRVTGKGALQVTANPKSEVFLNGKLIGQTPLCKCEAKDMLEVSEYTIRLVPQEGIFPPFEGKITINPSLLSVVDRKFDVGASSEGSIITLTKLDNSKQTQLLIVSFPDKSEVLLDQSPMGQTPLLLKDITASDHEIKLVKKGYKEKVVRIRTVLGFKLVATIYLGVSPQSQESTPLASPSASPTPTPLLPQVEILQTPTGFLRVRTEANVGSKEVGRVNPSETFDLVEQTSGWYKIRLNDGTTGWISSQYARKL